MQILDILAAELQDVPTKVFHTEISLRFFPICVDLYPHVLPSAACQNLKSTLQNHEQ